ncbi:hypothetical protein RFI_27293 [Reticulomyxa filosa]|uniref:Ubiquitin-like domain-containing protein n=1 Tax=Reticulomyxa filosa TaxID=46433 RepID=X6M7X4_RETFI|nr:hypothetical protein RFI_27293 [Reticulomyxa filosa]|eukprot:ETO10083.1 hypothetical protein RFI_27293 [Reticulomyxa filosa]
MSSSIKKCTVFLTTKKKEILALLKARLGEAINVEPSDIQLRTIVTNKEHILDENKSIQELKLDDDNVVFYVLKTPSIFYFILFYLCSCFYLYVCIEVIFWMIKRNETKKKKK